MSYQPQNGIKTGIGMGVGCIGTVIAGVCLSCLGLLALCMPVTPAARESAKRSAALSEARVAATNAEIRRLQTSAGVKAVTIDEARNAILNAGFVYSKYEPYSPDELPRPLVQAVRLYGLTKDGGRVDALLGVTPRADIEVATSIKWAEGDVVGAGNVVLLWYGYPTRMDKYVAIGALRRVTGSE